MEERVWQAHSVRYYMHALVMHQYNLTLGVWGEIKRNCFYFSVMERCTSYFLVDVQNYFEH